MEKFMFIIREDFAENFKNTFEPKLKGKIETEYVYQEMDAYLGEYSVPEGRTKPWGTSHAILCASKAVNEPFAVINADDFYGKDAFKKAHNFLSNECDEKTYALLGYELSNTLSENGSVSRGVCEVDQNNNLVQIVERLKVYEEDGKIVYEEGDGSKHEIPENFKASMNFWCFHPSLFPFLANEFQEFLKENINTPKAEFLIPHSADRFIKKGLGIIKVIPTAAQWFGVTYKEDAPGVKQSIKELVEVGEYPPSLWK